MRIERIESKGLAHYSYFVADQGEALVIDPRLDGEVYTRLAREAGCRIGQILETHRNEDYLIGSVDLATRTGAAIGHADAQWDYAYGQAVAEGQCFQVGRLTLCAMHTPGHTPGSMSYVLSSDGGAPWMVFTGDALLAGDVGRTDLLGPDQMRSLGEALHNTLFEKLLPLGDEIIVCPAHGSGSACGGSISERPWTTIGVERNLNPKLRLKRDHFIDRVSVERDKPPYFREMEAGNLGGVILPTGLPVPPPVEPADFLRLSKRWTVLDARDHLAFGGCHIPGAISIWREGVSSYAGWLLEPRESLLLVCNQNDLEDLARRLVRMGFVELPGYLRGDLLGWQTAGLDTDSVPMMTTRELCRRLDDGEEVVILDVRETAERASDGTLPGALTIPLQHLPRRLASVPEGRTVDIFCGSGLRSMAAASLLLRSEKDHRPRVVLGGIQAWDSTACPVELP